MRSARRIHLIWKRPPGLWTPTGQQVTPASRDPAAAKAYNDRLTAELRWYSYLLANDIPIPLVPRRPTDCRHLQVVLGSDPCARRATFDPQASGYGAQAETAEPGDAPELEPQPPTSQAPAQDSGACCPVD